MKRNFRFGDVAGFLLCGGLLAAGPAWAGFGDLDTSFGPGTVQGFTIHDLGGDADSGLDLVTGLNDRLYALGITCNVANCAASNKIVLTRYDENGILDTSFGSNGDLTLKTNVNSLDYRIEVDDRNQLIYLSTVFCNATACAVAVERFDFTGQPDPSYGNSSGAANDGITSFPTFSNNPSVQQLLLQPNGKLLLLLQHETRDANGQPVSERFNVVRLNADGSVDGNWGNNGSVDVSTPGGCDLGASMMIGRSPVLYVTAAKASTCAGPYTPVLRRFRADGTLDPNFASDGELDGNLGQTGDFVALVAQEQPNLQIAYGIGSFSNGQDFHIDIVMLNNDGSEDTSFTPQHGDYVHDPHFLTAGNSQFQTTGKLVLNGRYTASNSTNGDEALTRIDGSALFAHPPRFAPYVRFARCTSAACQGTSSVQDVVPESAGTVTIEVDLCATNGATCDPFVTQQPITVPFTLGGDATRGFDYTVPSTSVTIPAGASSGTIAVTIVDDDIQEFGESILFTLGNAPGVLNTTGNNAFILGITDNDLAPGQTGGSTDNGGAIELDLLAGLLGLFGLRRIGTRRR